MQIPPLTSQPQQLAGPAHVMIKDLRPSALNNIDTVFIILEKGATTINADVKVNKMVTSLAADSSAAVHLRLWGHECDFFQPGDIVRMTRGIFSSVNGSMLLRAGRRGKLEKIGEFTMVFVESPNMSKLQWVQDPSNPSQWNPVGLQSAQMPQIANTGSTGSSSGQRVPP